MNREASPYSARTARLKDGDSSPSSRAGLAVYWMARTFVALAGLGALTLPVMVAKEHPRS
jgi:hypothetical protein